MQLSNIAAIFLATLSLALPQPRPGQYVDGNLVRDKSAGSSRSGQYLGSRPQQPTTNVGTAPDSYTYLGEGNPGGSSYSPPPTYLGAASNFKTCGKQKSCELNGCAGRIHKAAGGKAACTGNFKGCLCTAGSGTGYI